MREAPPRGAARFAGTDYFNRESKTSWKIQDWKIFF